MYEHDAMSKPADRDLMVSQLRRMALGDGSGEHLRSDERELLNAAAEEIEDLRFQIKRAKERYASGY